MGMCLITGSLVIGLLGSGAVGAATTSTILLGGYEKPRLTDPVVTGNPGKDAVLHMESRLGRKLTLDHVYYHFDDQWPTERQTWDRANGRTPFINWSPENPTVTWAQVAAGQTDAIIDARARAAKAFVSTVYLAFDHEPENDTAIYGTPADYVAAWRHVRARFNAAGVTNVRFVMILTAWTYTIGQADPWYPGSSVVDYVGADGYNWYPGKTGSKWREMSAIFTPFYDWAVARGKPAIIAEAGSQEDPANPTRKANWFRNGRTWLSTKPEIKAFVYFDSDMRYKWWVDSSTGSLAAYREGAQDPMFG